MEDFEGIIKMRKQKRDNIGYIVLLTILFIIVVVLQLHLIREHMQFQKIYYHATYHHDKFRALTISDDVLDYLDEDSKNNGNDFIRELTLRMIVYDYELDQLKKVKKLDFSPEHIQAFCNMPLYTKLYEQYTMLFRDSKVFPVAEDIQNGESVQFENSWLTERTYGGKRGHEGTDIIPTKNVRGYYPVVSISDGVIEQKGWLEKGGWRIGVRSASGCYYYYAHLASYEKGLEKGDKVKAGQVLGYMGDTGYSKVEGTTGNFVVHLHMGVYLGEGENEYSVNSYPILRWLEKNKVGLAFSN